ncbi:MAG TPA: hypothetical protein VJ951_00920 [Bacteroidales bacterium]|nr:hypothetical protein [Bacteroidales bacterium]
MKKFRSTVLILALTIFAGSAYGQANDYGLKAKKVSPDELMNWTLLGDGTAQKGGPRVAFQESDDSKGIMFVSPEAYSSDVIVRYKVMALTPATVLVALLSVSDLGETEDLTVPSYFDGSLGLFLQEKENYFFAFKNGPHNLTPFVRKSPYKGESLGSAKENLMIAGVYYDVEVGNYQGKLWLTVDGEKLFEVEDDAPLGGGHIALRIRGTAGLKAACMIKDLEILSE